MSDIVVFISPKFTVDDKQKIAELMRMREIKTTDDRRNATVVLEPVLYDKQSEHQSIVIATDPKNQPQHWLISPKKLWMKPGDKFLN